MKVYFDNPEFDGQLLRALGYVYYGGADVSEYLTTAQRIQEGDAGSWYDEWCRAADGPHTLRGDRMVKLSTPAAHPRG
jgi:hypothetical protein